MKKLLALVLALTMLLALVGCGHKPSSADLSGTAKIRLSKAAGSTVETDDPEVVAYFVDAHNSLRTQRDPNPAPRPTYFVDFLDAEGNTLYQMLIATGQDLYVNDEKYVMGKVVSGELDIAYIDSLLQSN